LGKPTLLFLCLISCASAMCAQAPSAGAQRSSASRELPTIDDITEKCAKASGGREAWAKLSSQVLTATIELVGTQLSGKAQISSKAPNKSFHLLSLADGRFEEKQGFDGKVGWKYDSQNGLKLLQGAELEHARMEAVFDTDIRLKEIYPDMKVVGLSKIEDRDAYAVLTHEPGDKSVTFYFDAKTGLRIAEDSEGPEPNGKVEKTQFLFEDYRLTDGIQIPFRVRIISPSVTLNVNVQEVRHNVAIDDSLFAVPADDHAKNLSVSSAVRHSESVVDEGEVHENVYTNRFYGMRYEFPQGWVVHGDETKKRVLELGRNMIAGDDPVRKSTVEVAEKHTQMLLSVFQYPVGTPVDYNPMIQVMSEDVAFAPGIRTGKEYLQNVIKVLQASSVPVEIEGEPTARDVAQRQFFYLHTILHVKDKLIYESFCATIVQGHALGFLFATGSPETRELLEKTLTTVQFRTN
jgi:hypothetical protein